MLTVDASHISAGLGISCARQGLLLLPSPLNGSAGGVVEVVVVVVVGEEVVVWVVVMEEEVVV